MKKLVFLALALLSTASFAESYICNQTGFSDIKAIVVTMDLNSSEVFVTEVNPESSSTAVSSVQKDGSYSSDLSGWNGYTRVFVKDSYGFSIEVADECTGHSVNVTCSKID